MRVRGCPSKPLGGLLEASGRAIGGVLESSRGLQGPSGGPNTILGRYLEKIEHLEVPVWNLFELKIVFFRLSRGIAKELGFWMEFVRVLQAGKREKTSFPVWFCLFFVRRKNEYMTMVFYRKILQTC